MMGTRRTEIVLARPGTQTRFEMTSSDPNSRPRRLPVLRRSVLSRIVGEATPGSLGAIRMWTCAILFLTTALEDLGSIALLPVEVRQSRGVLGYLYNLPIGLEGLVTSEMSLRSLQLLTELFLLLGLVGWRTRVVIPLGAFCHFLLLGIL